MEKTWDTNNVSKSRQKYSFRKTNILFTLLDFFIQNHFSGLSCQIFLPVSSCRVINAIIHTYEIKIGKQTHVCQKIPLTHLHSFSFTDHKFKSYLSRCKLILTFPTFLLLLPIDICFELFTIFFLLS